MSLKQFLKTRLLRMPELQQEETAARNRVLAYVHIPKTAGTSFTNFLKQCYQSNEIIEVLDWGSPNERTNWGVPYAKIPPETLKQCKLITGHCCVNSFDTLFEQPPNYITMLRDPVDYFLSIYNFSIRKYEGAIGFEKTRKMSFLEFLKDEEIRFWYKDPQTGYLNKSDYQNNIYQMEHRQSKRDPEQRQPFVSIPDDVLFERTQEILRRFFFVGITEKFQESVFLLSHSLGFLPTLEHCALNKTKEKFVERKNLTQEELEAMRDFMRVDQRLYDYALKTFTQKYDEMVFELLSKRYDGGQSAAKGSLRFDFIEVGNGWHGKETSPRISYNWTGPETVSKLTFARIPARRYAFKIQIVHWIARDILESLKMEVNGCPVEYTRRRHFRKYMLRGIIPREIAEKRAGDLEIKFYVNRTQLAVPSAPASPANRLLGIAFNYLELTAL